MKKINAFVLAGLLIFSLAACGQKQTDTQTEQKEAAAAEVTEALQKYETRAFPNKDGSFGLYCEVTE